MGQTILTPHQFAVLEQAANEPSITEHYYFTGGTALAACYLYHRYSKDLDFFTSENVDETYLDEFFDRITPTAGIASIEKLKHFQMIFYDVTFVDTSTLRIDFVKMDYPHIEEGIRYNDTSLRVDSVFDIALNKFRAIANRATARDFVDLYCILTTQGISLEQVFLRMYDKYAPFSYEDAMNNIERLVSVLDVVSDYPEMLIPFDREKMIDFFLAEAKKLEGKIFK